MQNKDKPIANPSVVLREEFDDWALLFHPDTNQIFTVDPVAAYIWKRLNGKSTLGDIISDLGNDCDDMPPEAEKFVGSFIQDLTKRGLVGYEVKE